MVIALIESNRLIEFNRRGTSERIDGLLTISQGVEKLAAEHGVHVQAQRLLLVTARKNEFKCRSNISDRLRERNPVDFLCAARTTDFPNR